jgi:hypothetical protein
LPCTAFSGEQMAFWIIAFWAVVVDARVVALLQTAARCLNPV